MLNRTTLTVAPRKPLNLNYSVFGSLQQKISNYTKQAKLAGWSG